MNNVFKKNPSEDVWETYQPLSEGSSEVQFACYFNFL